MLAFKLCTQAQKGWKEKNIHTLASHKRQEALISDYSWRTLQTTITLIQQHHKMPKI